MAAAFSPIFSHEFASQHHDSIRMASFLGVLACRFDKLKAMSFSKRRAAVLHIWHARMHKIRTFD